MFLGQVCPLIFLGFTSLPTLVFCNREGSRSILQCKKPYLRVLFLPPPLLQSFIKFHKIYLSQINCKQTRFAKWACRVPNLKSSESGEEREGFWRSNSCCKKMAHKAVRNLMGSLIQKRWNHSPAALVLPEFENTAKTVIPHLPSGASMELMAVPKKKVSRHKRGIRNGPKALKPVPVIVRCKSCGRVKLPHFYCCSGERGSNERNNSTS